MTRLVLAVLLLALAGCSAAPTAVRSASPPAVVLTASTPAPPPAAPSVQPTPTYDDLVAALPTGAGLAPWTLVDKCLSQRLTCAREGRGHTAHVSAEGRTSAQVPESVLLSVALWPGPQGATRKLRRWHRLVAGQVDGHFDQPPRDTDDGFRFGYVGSGHLAAWSVGSGWRGFRSSATLRYRHRDGRVSTPTRYVEVLLARGPVTVQVNLRQFATSHLAPPDARLDALLAPVLSALDRGG